MSIADDIFDGLQCTECGTMFVKPHGYSVRCKSCWRNDGGIQRATLPEMGEDEETSAPEIPNPPKSKPHACPHCSKRFATPQGLADHAKDKHEVEAERKP